VNSWLRESTMEGTPSKRPYFKAGKGRGEAGCYEGRVDPTEAGISNTTLQTKMKFAIKSGSPESQEGPLSVRRLPGGRT